MQFTSVNDFLTYVQIELSANRLVLPTLPDVALKVREQLNESNVNAEQLARVIMTDAALSARLIQVTNSPLFRGTTEVTSIQMAVTRLGAKTIVSLVTSIIMQQIFAPKSDLLADYFVSIWKHSVNVSSISRALASFVPHLNAEEAMLAGLLHQIGKLPILFLIEKIPEFKNSPSRLNVLLEKAHPAIGKIIMDTWFFPNELKRVPSEYIEFHRDTDPKADYVDVVQVAFLESIINSDHPANRIDRTTVPAFAKLGLKPDMDVLEIKDVADKIALTSSLFN